MEAARARVRFGRDKRRTRPQRKSSRLMQMVGFGLATRNLVRLARLDVAARALFDAIGEHTGAGHNHKLVVPFGGESPGSEGPES
ncbi:hypothetical protein M5K25_023629 [Dendrobium thyrsiflorum]|uniref:Uncharacterized protein n=1 Tax=Dendrobium thyrsiflorum TaxID=117978 RepID=A0ABD0U8H1_DENTH